MNTIKLSILTLAFCMTGMAHDDNLESYTCKSYDEKIELSVKGHGVHRNHTTAFITIVSDKGVIELDGISNYLSDDFMNKKVYSFKNLEGSLEIITKPKFCGRGSCDYDSGTIITGKLELENSEIYFSCYE